MTETTHGKGAEERPRDARLKAALKANLARRKQQTRARRGEAPGAAAQPPDPMSDTAPNAGNED